MAATERQGCLAAILGLFGIHLGGPAVNGTATGSGILPYRLRDDFLSPAELSFYRVLRQVLRDRVIVLAKVNLADLVFVTRPEEKAAYRNKIDRKHVDFLLCDPATMKPLAAIELDDASHQRRDRKQRDEFVNRVFQAAGLPLLRFPAQASYNPQELATAVASHLNDPPAASRTLQQPRSVETPQCPKCGLPMVLRVASKGANAGRKFWGCPNYPRCRQVSGAT